MPRLLFYAGIVCTAVAAMFATGEALRQLQGGLFHFGLGRAEGLSHPGGRNFALGTLLFVIPITALFVRMGSLIAARNLFASFFSLFASMSAALALVFLAFMQLRNALLVRVEPMALQSGTLAEVNLVAFYAFGLFLALALVLLRPHFLIQSSRFLSVMVCLPLPVFGLLILQQLFGLGTGLASQAHAWFVFSFFASLSILFFAIPVHSFRHRHLFLEKTNLRELLDPRIDPAVAAGGEFIRGGVAYDS
jgi:hypothetical protein